MHACTPPYRPAPNRRQALPTSMATATSGGGEAAQLAERLSDVQLQETMVPPVLGGGSRTIRTPTVTVTPKLDPSRTMRALEWHGKKSVRLGTRPAPAITDPVRGAGLGAGRHCVSRWPAAWGR